MTRPPALAARLLAASLPPEERAEILGDLEEQFHERAARAGAAPAARWYWREALSLSRGFWSYRARAFWSGAGPVLVPSRRPNQPHD